MQRRHHDFTVDAYLDLEEDSGTKHEFFRGQVWAMSGGTREHALYSANVSTMLTNALRGRRCAVHSSDLRVAVSATTLRTYADVSVICGRVELDTEDRKGTSVLNPCLLVEVLSPSTEDYDRGEKLGHYKHIASLREVVLVAHDRREVEVVRREADGSWSRHVFRDGDAVALTSLDCELPVVEIYRDPLAPAAKPVRPRRARRSR